MAISGLHAPKRHLLLYGPYRWWDCWICYFFSANTGRYFPPFHGPIMQDEKIINFPLSSRNFSKFNRKKDPQEMSIVRKHNKTGRE